MTTTGTDASADDVAANDDDDADAIKRTGPAGSWGRRDLLKAWILCGLFRLLNTAVLIDSYFDPDEFWQTLEPAYCLAFFGASSTNGTERGQGARSSSSPYATCPGFTWEWKRRATNLADACDPTDTNATGSNVTSYDSLYASYVEPSMWGPARSHLPIVPTYLLYVLLRQLRMDTSWAVARGPLLMNAVMVAAPVDVSVLYAASVLYEAGPSSWGWWCLTASLLSWFNLYSLVRTYSNSQETALLMVAIALVAPELLLQDDDDDKAASEDPPPTRASSSNGWWRACLAFYVGGWSTAVRFTSLAAFVPMGVLLAARHADSSTTSTTTPRQHQLFRYLVSFAAYVLGPCATCGLLGLLTSVVVDRGFYGFWTIPFLGLIHFNVVLNYAELYGSHPWHWYLTAGLPAVVGLLLVPLLISLRRMLRRRGPATVIPRGIRNLWCILTSYVTIMSFNSHKEFRYIHPVLPLVCLLTGPDLQKWAGGHNIEGSRSRWPRWGRTAAVVAGFGLANLIPVLYLGLFHQTGPVAVNRSILELARQLHAKAKEVEVEGAAEGKEPTITRFTVYYWTGECHSTPLHSHLHQPRHPSIKFDTWALDCSPSCRADPDPVACETHRFQADPLAFVQSALCLGNHSTDNAEEAASPKECRGVPDFVVTFSSYVRRLDPVLRQQLGMREVGRYPLHLTGVSLRTPSWGQGEPSRCWQVGGSGGDLCDDEAAARTSTNDDRAGIHERTSRSRRRVLGGPDTSASARRPIALDVETEDVVLYARWPPPPVSAASATCDASTDPLSAG